jgi:hypothetical protein
VLLATGRDNLLELDVDEKILLKFILINNICGIYSTGANQ